MSTEADPKPDPLPAHIAALLSLPGMFPETAALIQLSVLSQAGKSPLTVEELETLMGVKPCTPSLGS